MTRYEAAMLADLRANHADVLTKIRDTRDLGDEAKGKLKARARRVREDVRLSRIAADAHITVTPALNAGDPTLHQRHGSW